MRNSVVFVVMCGAIAVLSGCGTATSPTGPGTGRASSAASTSSTAPSAAASSTSSATASTSVAAKGGTATPAGIQLVEDWYRAAGQGQAFGVPFADRQNLSVVQSAWGSGPAGVGAGAGVYFTYSQHRVAFGVNQGEQIFDVRSDSPKVQNLTRADVTQALGPPGAVRYADGTTIYLYPDGPDYQLLWVFSGGPRATGQYVTHVDVFWPQGTLNLMAQTASNPGVVVTHAAGPTGRYLEFRITTPPVGYSLAELEWLPATGRGFVVATLPQAIDNGRQRVNGTFWAVSGGYRLSYTSAQAGMSGRIRLIYQNTGGGAIIGTSQLLTLRQ